jgi:hypothetical protein
MGSEPLMASDLNKALSEFRAQYLDTFHLLMMVSEADQILIVVLQLES